MIGKRFSIYIASILILIDLAVALNSDGFCSFTETYTEPATTLQTYKTTVTYTKKCGVFSTRICYDYRDRINYKTVIQHVQRTRTKKQCCEGYLQTNNKCIPVCSDPCLNGLCTEPNVCTCSSGYHKNDEGICIQNECNPSGPANTECPNGTCTSNGVCICNEGFIKSESTCLPKCSAGCSNGICISPDKCACNTGYQAFNASACSPICENACVFGTCTEPNKCTCLEGYELTNKSDYICSPICSTGCINGSCIAPELCNCDIGFEFNDESKQCDPICDEECVNSNCTSPNVCTCHTGFSQMNSTNCEINCENCANGYCEEPNICLCNIGYHDDGTCVQNECTPNVMEDICENGFCSDDGVCVCDSGYRKNGFAICEPICSLECINSFCSEPEVCQCYDGYDFIQTNGTDYNRSNCTNCTDDNGSNCTNCTIFSSWNICVAVCYGCQYGKCIDGICNCFDGYIQHPKNKGICLLPGELVYLEDEQSSSKSTYLAVGITMVMLGVVLGVVGVVAYKRYIRQISYKCNTDVRYYKEEDNNVF